MSEPILTSGDLLARFQALDSFLLQHQALWRPRPFHYLQLPWESELPELAAWLRSRSLEQAEAGDNSPFALSAPAPFPALAHRAQALSQLGETPSQDSPPRAHTFSVDVPGRKLAQIQAFASHLQFRQRPAHWLDWCSGKGHLGRWLTQGDQHLTCLEYDPALIESGSALSKRLGLAAAHLQQDVLADDCSECLHKEHTPVALHACGDLHVRLLQLASRKGCTQLAVAPCCYNRIAGMQYQPLSAAAQGSSLQLSRDDLGLPLSETVTAGARVRRQRNQSMAWRLAFDLLQRQLRGIDEYLPTPSLPSDWFSKPFASFCHDLAKLRDVPLPGEQDWPALEARGWQRLAEVRNLELLRNLFRRPLELWLLLDRALYLEEQGYHVKLGTFCNYQLSPRNLLLLAERD
ncbi:methyltransferase [Pseudomonas sp. o96-267]|uniref:methyltransferase n=1 Tax=Pseudomonas sp. o96-267 TaxID=2479853 RepID=UPI000F7ADCE4|nr:methyltransferase [Pseudomonas sp. o96-267]RRV36866.1 methyltransferase [Pseudomonas sp. o96-267]